MARPSGRRTSQFHLPSGNPNPMNTAVENNFIEGFKTEYTGLNFPENACTNTFDCRFNRTGEVSRRKGFDFEANNAVFTADRTNQALSTFLWTNVGGDGNTKLLVAQVGPNVVFYDYSTSNVGQPLSTQKLTTTINLNLFAAAGATFDVTKECQYTAGNGYLFIFHPTIDPLYCTFNSSNLTVTANTILINIRDFIGIPEVGIPDTLRPTTLTNNHSYNLQNQGWILGSTWTATTPFQFNFNMFWGFLGFGNFTIQNLDSTAAINIGDTATASGLHLHAGEGNIYPIGGVITLTGLVTSKSTNSITINVTQVNPASFVNNTDEEAAGEQWTITGGANTGQINKWVSQIGGYPSNSDIWYSFKDSTGTFNPAATIGSVVINTAPAPKGSFIFNAFNQNRSAVSKISGLTSTTTTVRPRTGVWFAGRVFYSGVDANFQAINEEPYYTWTENIYFSQIIVKQDQFGKCYQTNDPTAEFLNALLPSDGGVIVIQGSGSIYKLFPVQNGLLVFATNGIWFITGSQGIGFTATDFTITKLSGVRTISATSFIDIDGWPCFWTEDGIYTVTPGQGGLQIQNLVIPTIRSFFATIPLSAKKLARGAYNRITGEVQWVYLSIEAASLTAAYQFDHVLNFYTYTGAFYPWTISPGVNLHDITYIESPGGLGTAPSVFKYFTSFIGPTIPALPPFSLGNVAVNNAWANSSSVTVTLSCNAGAILTLLINQGVTPPTVSPTVSGVTSTSGLNWQKRFSCNQQDTTFDNTKQDMELWWAYSINALTSEVITVTTTSNVQAGVISIAEFRGLTASPWSSNISCPTTPALQPGGNFTATSNPLSSNTTTPVVLFWHGSGQANGGVPASPAFTSFNASASNIGPPTVETRSGYFVFNTQQTNATYACATPTASWMVVADAFEQFPPPVPGAYNFTFSEERDNVNWADWATLANQGAAGFPVQYISTFTTGYKLHGKATRKWQPEYVYMYTNSNVNQYQIQGVWNYANNQASNKISTRQNVINNNTNFDKMYRRHRIRGLGTVFQLKVNSIAGNPFSFSGWALEDVINQNV